MVRSATLRPSPSASSSLPLPLGRGSVKPGPCGPMTSGYPPPQRTGTSGFSLRSNVHPTWGVCTVPPPFVLSWGAFIRRRCLDRPTDPCVHRSTLAATFRHLQLSGGLPPEPFHSLRRACAAYMFAAGHSVPGIADWCRWRSRDTAEQYIGTGHNLGRSWVDLPGPPFGSGPPWQCVIVRGDWSFLWRSPASGGALTTPEAPGWDRRKRSRGARS